MPAWPEPGTALQTPTPDCLREKPGWPKEVARIYSVAISRQASKDHHHRHHHHHRRHHHQVLMIMMIAGVHAGWVSGGSRQREWGRRHSSFYRRTQSHWVQPLMSMHPMLGQSWPRLRGSGTLVTMRPTECGRDHALVLSPEERDFIHPHSSGGIRIKLHRGSFH